MSRIGMLFGFGLLVSPCAIAAQVMEVGEDGTVIVYDRPAVFSGDGAVTISSPTRRSRRAARPAPDLSAAIGEAAGAAAVDADLVEAVAWQESRFRAGVVSRAGAIGEMQLMPATARALGVDPHDSLQNVRGGAAYLGALMRRYDGDIVRSLAAYNAGPGAVDRYGGVPPFRETRAYVAAIMNRLSARAVSKTQVSER